MLLFFNFFMSFHLNIPQLFYESGISRLSNGKVPRLIAFEGGIKLQDVLIFEYVLFAMSIGISLVYLCVPLILLRPHATSEVQEIGMSILIPCFNEESTVEMTIEGLRHLKYSNYEVLFVNDGSEDSTFDKLSELLKLKSCARDVTGSLSHSKIIGLYESEEMPNVLVVNKVNGGKADSLNAAICYARHDVVVSLDADSVLAPDALIHAAKGMSKPRVIAGGGFVRVLQGSSPQFFTRHSFRLSFILKLQTLEYLRGFFLYKAVMGSINGILVIPGVFGMFRREVMLEVGGYSKTIGEDMDITLKFHAWGIPRGKVIRFFPDSICYTECPENWRDLYNQRIRWQKSLVDCIRLHGKHLIIHPSWVTFVLLIDSFFVNTFGPFSTVGLVLWAVLWIHKVSITSLPIVIWVLIGIGQTCSSLYVNRRFGARYSVSGAMAIFITCLFEFGYRVWNIIVIIIGTLSYFRNRNAWNKVRRSGRLYHMVSPDNFVAEE